MTGQLNSIALAGITTYKISNELSECVEILENCLYFEKVCDF